MKKLFVFPTESPWQHILRFSYDPKLKAALKDYPGVSWKTGKWGNDWTVPHEGLEFVEAVATAHGYKTENYAEPSRETITPAVLPESFWPFQKSAVKSALASLPINGGYILNFEMGLGKTPTAIEILKQTNTTNTLVVCPAMVAKNWQRELDKWWPEHPEIMRIKDGQQAKDCREVRGITICSYGLLPKLPGVQTGAVIFDELHYLQGEFAGRTLASVRLLRANPHALRLGLTGTLIANQPLSIWKPLDVLWPNRYGTRSGFGRRYCNIGSENEYGRTYVGARADTAEELRRRLEIVSVRATKNDPDIAKLLPPLIVQRAFTNRADRLRDAADAAVAAIGEGARKVVVLGYHREAARNILGRLRSSAEQDTRLSVVTGEDAADHRDDILAGVRDSAGCEIVVATLRAVGIGIDLTWADVVILAELDHSPVALAQLFGRFSRLSGIRSVVIMVLLDGDGDAIGESLVQKFTDISSIIAPGTAEGHLVDVLNVPRRSLTAEEMNALLSGMAENAEEEYG